jgi:hypothetical protein
VRLPTCTRKTSLCLAVVTTLALLPAHAVAFSRAHHDRSVGLGAAGYRPKIDYRVGGYRPRPVPARELLGYQDFVTPLTAPNIAVDARGVVVSNYDGHRVYHPLVIARYGITLLQSYRITHDQAYRDVSRSMPNSLSIMLSPGTERGTSRTASTTFSLEDEPIG